MKKVKNIIFDLGGVILNIDYSLTVNAFKKLGIPNPDLFYSKKIQDDIFDKLETGSISESFFLNQLIKKTSKAEKKDIKNAWNAMLQNLPNKRIKLISSLKKEYKIFLLSNTNSIHLEMFKKSILKGNWKKFSNMFNKMYFSHEIKLRKPNKKAFRIILDENAIKAKETLFIDDSLQHIITAKKLGLYTYHLKEGEELVTLFPDIIQLTHH